MKQKTATTIVDALCALFQKHHLFKPQEITVMKKKFQEVSEGAFEDFLLEEGLIEKENLLPILEEFYKVPALDVEGIFFEHHLLSMFPKDAMLRNMFIPYQRDGDVLIVVAAHPSNGALPEIIGQFVSYDVTFMVGLTRDIKDAIEDFIDVPITQQEQDFIPEEVEEKQEDESFKDIVDRT